MPFHEMPAKNIGIRQALGAWVLVANADVILGREVIAWMGRRDHDPGTLYRAHRIDVARDLPFERLEESTDQQSSGKGARQPCTYLGAGGDFCFASRALWHELGGFDEGVRFTTRGKDWQFFLSAAERHVPITFVGRVYHLDHEGGFRNTPDSERDSASVHFGTWWDIEAAVPIRNHPEWGLAGVALQQDMHESRLWRIPADSRWPADDDSAASASSWLSSPAGQPDDVSPALLHHFLRAAAEQRRVVADFTDPPALSALAGLAAVARPFGVETYSRAGRPPVRWACAPVRFIPDLSLRESDLVLTIHDGTVSAHADDQALALRCARFPDHPAFNPLLARRLLRAWLTLQAEGAHRLAIYGAGDHTEQVLRWGIPTGVSLRSIVVTQGGGTAIRGVPVASLATLRPVDVDAVLLSSATYESEMCETASALGFRAVPLYADWPHAFWSVPPAPTPLAAPA
jgi:hypothetical protein